MTIILDQVNTAVIEIYKSLGYAKIVSEKLCIVINNHILAYSTDGEIDDAIDLSENYEYDDELDGLTDVDLLGMILKNNFNKNICRYYKHKLFESV